jgi:hypothetical protein
MATEDGVILLVEAAAEALASREATEDGDARQPLNLLCNTIVFFMC